MDTEGIRKPYRRALARPRRIFTFLASGLVRRCKVFARFAKALLRAATFLAVAAVFLAAAFFGLAAFLAAVFWDLTGFGVPLCFAAAPFLGFAAGFAPAFLGLAVFLGPLCFAAAALGFSADFLRFVAVAVRLADFPAKEFLLGTITSAGGSWISLSKVCSNRLDR